MEHFTDRHIRSEQIGRKSEHYPQKGIGSFTCVQPWLVWAQMRVVPGQWTNGPESDFVAGRLGASDEVGEE